MGKPSSKKKGEARNENSPTKPDELLKLVKADPRWVRMVVQSLLLLVALVCLLGSSFLILDVSGATVAMVYAILGMIYVVVRRVLTSRYSDLLGLNANELRDTLDAVFAVLGAQDHQGAIRKANELHAKSTSLAELLEQLGRKQAAQAKLRVDELLSAFPRAEELRKLLLKLGAKDFAEGETLAGDGVAARKDLANLLTLVGAKDALAGREEIERRAAELEAVQAELLAEQERHQATRERISVFPEPTPSVVPVYVVRDAVPAEPVPFFGDLSDEEARRRLAAYPIMEQELQRFRDRRPTWEELFEQGSGEATRRLAAFPEMETELLALRKARESWATKEAEFARENELLRDQLREASDRELRLRNEKDVLSQRVTSARAYYERQHRISRAMLERIRVISDAPEEFESEMIALLSPKGDLYRSAGTRELFHAARKLKGEVDRLLVVQYAAATMGSAGRWDLMDQLFRPLMTRRAFDQVLPRMDTSVRVWVNEHTLWPGIA